MRFGIQRSETIRMDLMFLFGDDVSDTTTYNIMSRETVPKAKKIFPTKKSTEK
jgi:hypothetical protein